MAYCRDLAISPTTVIPEKSTFQEIKWDKAASISALSIACSPPKKGEATFFCDIVAYDTKIYELKLKLDPTKGLVTKETEQFYEKFGGSFTHFLASSSDYLVSVNSNFEEKWNKVLVHKRRHLPEGGPYVFYSVDLKEIIKDSPIAESRAYPYFNPKDNLPKMMIMDQHSKGLAKVYNISTMQLDVKGLSFYDQRHLGKVFLTVNKDAAPMAKISLYNVFFDQNRADKDIDNMKETSLLWDYLGWWIALGIVTTLIIVILLLYFCRRELLKNYQS